MIMGGLITEALSTGISGGGSGGSVAQQIEALPTVWGGDIDSGNTYRYLLKVGSLGSWEYSNFFHGYSGTDYAYPQHAYLFNETFFCVYKGSEFLYAVKYPYPGTDYRTCRKYTERSVWTWSGGYKVLPTMELEELGKIVTDCELYNTSSWSSDKTHYNLKLSITYVSRLTTHHWTYVAPNEFTDEPTIETIQYAAGTGMYDIVPSVGTLSMQQVYTDLSDERLLTECSEISVLIYNDLNS